MKRRSVLFGAAAAALPVSAAARLGNITLDPAGAKLTREPFGDLRIYFDGPTEQLSHMTAGSLRLNAGASPHPPHQHPEEEFMLITSGSGELMVDGKTTRVSQGSMMYCGANKLHGIVNTGKAPLEFFFYKWKA